MHTLAFNDPLKGLSPERLRYSLLGPATDVGFIEEARRRFVTESAYLDDRPGAPLRFLAEANLSLIIRREEQHVDAGDARADLHDRIKRVFSGDAFELVPFPGGPFDVPDDAGDGRPRLIVPAYDGVAVGDSVDAAPELIARIYTRKGAEGSALRMLRNHLVFAVADAERTADMQGAAVRRLALQALLRPERLAELAEHQQATVREQAARSEQELAVAIQQCYRHLFYPSRNRVGAADVDLAHTAIDLPAASDQPGAGQRQVVRALRELAKLRLAEDEPDSPAYVRDRTPLKRGQITTLALRDEFRRDPALPILSGDDIFLRGIRRGVEGGDYVYQRGELLYGPDDPPADLLIDERALVLTMAYARNKEIWPRPAAPGSAATEGDDRGRRTEEEVRQPQDGGLPPVKRAPEPGEFTAEGVLREALTRLWEQARAGGAAQVSKLTIRMFEAGDGFRLLGAVGAVAGADKAVTMAGGYETRDGGSFMLEFNGSVADAQPVREFLEPQLRDCISRTLEVSFRLTFAAGLPLAGDAAERLTERLARFAGGAAYVAATAAAQEA